MSVTTTLTPKFLVLDNGVTIARYVGQSTGDASGGVWYIQCDSKAANKPDTGHYLLARWRTWVTGATGNKITHVIAPAYTWEDDGVNFGAQDCLLDHGSAEGVSNFQISGHYVPGKRPSERVNLFLGRPTYAYTGRVTWVISDNEDTKVAKIVAEFLIYPKRPNLEQLLAQV